MWVLVVWLLQGLVSSTAGVYLNTPCIRSLLKCTPFQLSLSDGKFSSNFIEDTMTLDRRCRSIDPLLECLQEAELEECSSLKISPSEKEFIKTRLFIAEVCKDVVYTQKAYLRNAACINSQKDSIMQACDPYEYVQLVNTSNLISLEGSCLFQNLLINCRRDVIHDKCGPDAAELYQRVKSVDMNLDFLCLDGRDLKSPKFMLDVAINSYISLLLETLRPVLIMESSYLKDVVETSTEEASTTPKCTGKDCLSKRSKRAPYLVQDVAQHSWRRFGDVSLETTTEASEEPDVDSFLEEYFPDPSLMSGHVTAVTEPAHVEAAASAGMDSGLELEDSDSDGMFETTSEDSNVEAQSADSGSNEETSSEFMNHSSTGSETASVDYERSDVKVILGIPIPQFEDAQVDTTKDHNILDATGTDLDTIEESYMQSPCGIETSTDSDEFKGISTLCPEYIQSTSADLDADQEITTLYSDEQETPDMNTFPGTHDDHVTSSPNMDAFKEATTLFNNLEATTDSFRVQEINTLLYPGVDFEAASTENDAFIQETTTLYPSDHETSKADSNTSEENILSSSLSPETMDGYISPGEVFSAIKGLFTSDEIESYVYNGSAIADLKNYFTDLNRRMKISPEVETEKAKAKVARFLKELESYFNSTKIPGSSNLDKESSTSGTMYVQRPTTTDPSTLEEPTSSERYNLGGASTESSSLKDEKKEIGSNKEFVEYYLNIGREIENLFSQGLRKTLVSLFSPKKIERRFGGTIHFFDNDKISYMKSKAADDKIRIQNSKPIKAEDSESLNAAAVELPDSNSFEASDTTDVPNASDKREREIIQNVMHEGTENPKEHFALTTIKSIAQLGVKLNYVLIGESYIPIEIGYGDNRKVHHDFKTRTRKFKLYTSTPTKPSIRIPRDSEFFSSEQTSPSELVMDKQESLPLLNDDEMSNSEGEFPDFNCPDVAGNITPRISHLVDPEKKLRMENCFSVSDPGDGSQSDEEFPAKAEDTPNETDQEFRRSGDIKEVPESVDPRNLDLETMVALKFYGEILTELASLLPPGSLDSKTLVKRASSLVDVYRNYMVANAKTDPSKILKMALDELKSKRFQKRSELYTDGPYSLSKKLTYREIEEFSIEDGVRFIVEYSPESCISVGIRFIPKGTYFKDIPEAQYMILGETVLPIELHFTHNNKDYVHYNEVKIPKRRVPL